MLIDAAIAASTGDDNCLLCMLLGYRLTSGGLGPPLVAPDSRPLLAAFACVRWRQHCRAAAFRQTPNSSPGQYEEPLPGQVESRPRHLVVVAGLT